jgi:hypothetical protein
VLLRATAALVAVLDTGCWLYGEGDPVCRAGDPTLPAELELVVQTRDGELTALADGGTVPMTAPPQGGYVALIGVRVNNAELCGAELQIALIDPCSDRVIALERRPVSFRIADDLWAEPKQPAELSDYANVAACPSVTPAHDVDRNPAIVEAQLFEPNGRVTTRRIVATPSCEGDTWCECNCDVAYTSGSGDCNEDLDGGLACP